VSKAALFDWLNKRGSGVLLHPACFPGDQGIGTLDYSARSFIDFLSESRMKYWQVCPLGPTGFGDSPYQTFSAFAGNPYLIDLKQLVETGLLVEKDLDPFRFMPGSRVDFGLLYQYKWKALHKAFQSVSGNSKSAKAVKETFDSFSKQQSHWLDAYGLFMALKQKFEGRSWLDWPPPYRSFGLIKRNDLDAELLQLAEAHKFFQYLFYSQWSDLKSYANNQGIEIIGDIPIFVSLDSVDVWCNPENFQVDKKSGKPKAMAGCPPDYFSKDGQFWGNPLYDWSQHKKTNYAWWIERFKSSFELYDIVRIDHFRGFEAYWSVPASAKTAAEGKWIKGPGLAFFEAIQAALPDAKIIAEDLGFITPAVSQLLKDTGLPGMAVLQFAFGGENDNFYLPHELNKNSVIYPGTHDNDTSIGWYESAGEVIRDHVRRYFDVTGEAVGWDFIRASYRSVSNLAIIPLQDLMSLGSHGRMNEPGNALGNWQWRYQVWQLEQLRNESATYLKTLADLYNR
jgi:4-alpha-glucanotransferase